MVTGIQGARWYVVEVTGEPGHAGTAPLRGRKDALRAAVGMIAALQELMHDPDDLLRFTVGRLQVEPNSPNTVPGKVTFSIDFRHPEARVLDERGARIEAVCTRQRRPLRGDGHRDLQPAALRVPGRRSSPRSSARPELTGCRHMRMPSGAFHDANFLADLAPTGMIFVPCAKGISHSPAEYAKPEDLAAGARVLAATLVDARRRLSGKRASGQRAAAVIDCALARPSDPVARRQTHAR